MTYETFSAAQTEDIARMLSKDAEKGDIFCLSGELGAGKTIFSKGFAKGLGITATVTSPTFTIVNVYKATIPLYHFDVYRITNIEEMYDTGYEEYFYGDGICLIEWAETVKDIIPARATWINIKRNYSKGDDYRLITVGSPTCPHTLGGSL